MSCLISEVLSGELSPSICNAAVNAGGKLLKVVEMQHKYGSLSGVNGTKELSLCPANGLDERAAKIAKLESDIAALKS